MGIELARRHFTVAVPPVSGPSIRMDDLVAR
jgi:hypothetical protein